MKHILLLILVLTGISCSSTKKVYTVHPENELVNTRRYIGEFIDYRYTGPEVFGSEPLIWIKTSLYNSYGKLSAVGKKCEFSVGDKLYLRRQYSTPDSFGNWIYQIENDSSVVYRISEYRYENNAFVKAGL